MDIENDFDIIEAMTADNCGSADSRGSCRNCGNGDSDVIITKIAEIFHSFVDIDSIPSWFDKKYIEACAFIFRMNKPRGRMDKVQIFEGIDDTLSSCDIDT